jgi:uncharacterized protein (DUF58 family)
VLQPASAPDAVAAERRARPVTAPERVLQRLDWQVVRRLDGLLQGDYRSLFRGAGLDLASLREYEPGDDVRRIDWNVTARTTIPHVREYHEDREITAWFLLDLSPSVDFGTADGGRQKRSVLVDFTATLARLMTRRGNRVGAMFFASEVDRTLPAAGGRAQVLRIISDLMAEPRLKRAPVTDLGALFGAAHRQIRRRSMVIIVSDFISAPGWEKPLELLNRRHEVLAVRLSDPRETALPDVGPIVVEDAETGEQLIIDSGDPLLRARIRAGVNERDAQLTAGMRRAGVPIHRIGTADDLAASLVEVVARTQRRRV